MTVCKVLQPRSIVMTVDACWYCQDSNTTSCMIVIWPIGLKHCHNHADVARRDCNAYMHTTKQIPIHVAKKHSKLTRLLEMFEQSTFVIRRTSGVLETGWKPDAYSCISWTSEFGWTIPLSNSESLKYIPLNDFFRVDILEASQFPPDFIIELTRSLFELDQGIFAEDARQQTGAVEEFPDDECIGIAECQGIPCRVFLGNKKVNDDGTGNNNA
jgi:hypothetical protein